MWTRGGGGGGWQEVYQLYGLPATAGLLLTLQAGIACLKSAACDQARPRPRPLRLLARIGSLRRASVYG